MRYSAEVEEAHGVVLKKAAAARKSTTWKSSFSEPVLTYLEETLGRTLPRPSYLVDGRMREAVAGANRRGAGFSSDPERNRLVEQRAVKVAWRLLEGEGWTVTSREVDKVGYDLHCVRSADERHVEVKGIAGTEHGFIITGGELQKADTDDRFELLAVTSALSESPAVARWTGRQLRAEFEFEATAYRARRKGTK